MLSDDFIVPCLFFLLRLAFSGVVTTSQPKRNSALAGDFRIWKCAGGTWGMSLKIESRLRPIQ